MNETFIDLALIGRLIRRRSVTLVVLAVLGAAPGAALSLLLSPGYVSTSKVLLQGTRSPNELPGETQIATSLVVLNHVADDLNWGVTGNDLQRQVSAVIADGNVRVVSGAAATPQAAQRLADKVTTEYVNFSTQIVADAANATTANTQKARQVIQQKIDDANKQITQIQTSPAITAQGADGDQASAALQQQPPVLGLVSATRVDAPRPSLLQQVAHLGASVVAQIPAPLGGPRKLIRRSSADKERVRTAATPVRLVRESPKPVSVLELGCATAAAALVKDMAEELAVERAVVVVDDLPGDQMAAAMGAGSAFELVPGALFPSTSPAPTDSRARRLAIGTVGPGTPWTDLRPRLVLADHPTIKFRPVTPGTSANHVEVT